MSPSEQAPSWKKNLFSAGVIVSQSWMEHRDASTLVARLISITNPGLLILIRSKLIPTQSVYLDPKRNLGVFEQKQSDLESDLLLREFKPNLHPPFSARWWGRSRNRRNSAHTTSPLPAGVVGGKSGRISGY
jgi:hypothetical protein